MSIKNLLSDKYGVFFGIIIALFILSYYLSFIVPIEVIKDFNKPTYGISGKPVQICREVNYLEDTSITIDRAIMQNKKNGDIFTVSLSSITVARKKGVYDICRSIIIPDFLPSGDWVIRTFISYKYFIWNRTSEITEVPIKLIKE